MKTSTKLRLPPRIKALEAAGAIGDGRVHAHRGLDGSWRATVESSDRTRKYTVIIVPEAPGKYRAYSTDNGTQLRGYIGYPIIAVLMLAGILPRDPEIEETLKNIPWKKLNQQLRRYALVIEKIKQTATNKGLNPQKLENFMNTTRKKLAQLTITYDPNLPNT